MKNENLIPGSVFSLVFILCEKHEKYSLFLSGFRCTYFLNGRDLDSS